MAFGHGVPWGNCRRRCWGVGGSGVSLSHLTFLRGYGYFVARSRSSGPVVPCSGLDETECVLAQAGGGPVSSFSHLAPQLPRCPLQNPPRPTPPGNSGTAAGPHVHRPGSPARQISPLVIQPSAPAAASVRCDSRRAGAGHFSGACLAESTLTERRRVSDYLPTSLPFPLHTISAPHCLLRDEARESLAEKGISSTLGAPNLRRRPEDSSPTA